MYNLKGGMLIIWGEFIQSDWGDLNVGSRIFRRLLKMSNFRLSLLEASDFFALEALFRDFFWFMLEFGAL